MRSTGCWESVLDAQDELEWDRVISKRSWLARYVGPDKAFLWHGEIYSIMVYEEPEGYISVYWSMLERPLVYNNARMFSKEWRIINDHS